MPLEDVADLVQLAHVVVGQGGHPGAAPRDVLDQALLGEQADGFAQRRPADARAAWSAAPRPDASRGRCDRSGSPGAAGRRRARRDCTSPALRRSPWQCASRAGVDRRFCPGPTLGHNATAIITMPTTTSAVQSQVMARTTPAPGRRGPDRHACVLAKFLPVSTSVLRSLRIQAQPPPAPAVLGAGDHRGGGRRAGQLVGHGQLADAGLRLGLLDLVGERGERLGGGRRVHQHPPGLHQPARRVGLDDLAVDDRRPASGSRSRGERRASPRSASNSRRRPA